jgi:hypothetical protein
MALNINGTTGISGVDGSASAPALQGTDSNTGINFASDTVNINTGGVLRATVDSSGNLGIGTNDPAGESINGSQNLVIMDTSSDGGMNIKTGTSGLAQIHFSDTSGNGQGRLVYAHSDDSMRLFSAGSERLRVHSTGVVQVMSERLTLGTSVTNGGTSDGNFCIEFAGNTRNAMKTRDTDNTGTVNHFVLISGSTACGTITTSTGQAFFNNLSDYRSKENDVKITDGIEKIKLLRPIRFNYKVDKDTLCDGFFAHEVTAAVPTAVNGEKDAVDSEGEIDPQMLDTGKIIPLLTAALQEAIAKIEVLETKVAALEAG